MQLKLCGLNQVWLLCGQCEARVCSMKSIGPLTNDGLFRQLNIHNCSLQKVASSPTDKFFNQDTFQSYVEGVERYELFGCTFDHAIAIRYLPNKFTYDMEKSGEFNRVYITNFSNLILQYPDMSLGEFVMDEFDLNQEIKKGNAAIKRKEEML